MAFVPSARSQALQQQLTEFMAKRVLPNEARWLAENHRLNGHGDWQRWQLLPELQALKQEAREQGLWNLFLPDAELGAGLTTLEYAPLAEIMGHSLLAPELFNCNAPDTGNMEVLYHFGSPQQQARWLTPLLAGTLRSVFCMTEPEVASSDATNMAATIERDGDELVLNGHKWWSTGLGHPDAGIAIFMGLCDPDAERHRRHAMVLVPLDSPGVTIERMLTACGDYDAPYGHGQVRFDQVRVPADHLIKGWGEGFAIAQGRLGPGRIHHCMRCLGAAERSLALMIERGQQRSAFGRPLLKLGGNLEKVAEARIAIEQARLLTLQAAWKIDNHGVRAAMTDIAAIKVVAPRVLQQVVEMAIQLHGGAGLCQDHPLMGFYAQARALRLADGPDEVHLASVAKLELKRRGPA
ncbi:acyl-CoA dehydrogenase family protein [Ferrimonas balearica]|uniref:acyl-CoA dehydrogenase family protein n=1 Tax=Ferrimonas balearica TaxID=44012 RepID=UPI001C579759|nr:acyl-CoA dehydrogenase family protein [Ferrimonas balearica]MBW3164666.1 acyl-CoA dehydrogenase family protein [Ferrimonas balearica]